MKKILTGILLTILGSKAFAGTLICRLSDPLLANQVAQTYGLTLLDQTAGAPFVLYQTPEGTSTAFLQTVMSVDSRVVWAEDDGNLGTPESEGLPKSPAKGSTLPAVGDRASLQSYNNNVLKQINWSASIANSPGRQVRVAILDTGISQNSAYLMSKVDAWVNAIEPNEGPWDIPRQQDSNGDGKVDSKVGHGTMVAGIIDQISPQSRFVICRVADSDGNATAWSVIKGLACAVVNGAEVANISLGSTNRIIALSDVLDWCRDNNLLIVAAAGNTGTEIELFPANYSVAVGIAGLNADNTKAAFSSYDRGVIASGPAVGIGSIDWDGSISIWSGTSFSAPMATAMVADGLRRTTVRVKPSKLRQNFGSTGYSLDGLNPNYKQKLGTGLNYSKFVSAFKPSGL